MVTITLYARQQKKHRCIEQCFGLCGRGRGWDVLERLRSFKQPELINSDYFLDGPAKIFRNSNIHTKEDHISY